MHEKSARAALQVTGRPRGGAGRCAQKRWHTKEGWAKLEGRKHRPEPRGLEGQAKRMEVVLRATESCKRF